MTIKMYENDNLIISSKYKKMTISEIENEKLRLLKEIGKSDRPKKTNRKYNKSIVFKF